MRPSHPLRVVHLVSAMDAGESVLWGKERVIATLMRAQFESGLIRPELVTFSPCRLAQHALSEGFPVDTILTRHAALSGRALQKLLRLLVQKRPLLLHTHGYKANIVGRILRVAGVPMQGLISTCHGWMEDRFRLRLYNCVDRATASLSDVVTVPDEKMLARLPRRARSLFIPNGIEYRAPVSANARLTARARFELPRDRFMVGLLGRLETGKGTLDVVEAARRTMHLPVQWVIAGSGPLEQRVRLSRLPNITLLGYVRDSEEYLNAIDVYLQASHAEGLSLALLEAMRAGLPIVATRAGSTTIAARPTQECIAVTAGDIDAIISAVCKLKDDPEFAAELAAAARQRFEHDFIACRQHEDFLTLYRSCESKS